VDEAVLKQLGARGVMRPSARDLQVVIGPTADQLAREMRESPAVERMDTSSDALLAAFGGRANVQAATAFSSRILVTLADPAAADAIAVDTASPCGAVETGPGQWQIIVAHGAAETAKQLLAK
jgi:PTS system N-acetylglucosamine-specific IIC component